MLILAAILTMFVYGLISPMLGAMLPSYGLSAAEQGSLTLANALGLVMASLSAGPLVDLKGKRPALFLGLSLVVVALFLLPRAGGYAVLLPVYCGLGIGGGIVSTGTNSLVSDMSPNRRGPALNFLNLFFGLGGIVTTYAASYLFTPVAICYSIAILAVLAMFTCYFAPMVKAAGAVGFRLSEVPRLLGNPLLILFSLLLFFYVACEVGVWNWLKAYLISAHLDARTAGGTVSYGFASGMLLGRLLVSRILTKVSAMHVLSMAAPLIALTTFGVLRAGSSILGSPISGSRISVTALVFGAGLAMAPVFPTTLALVGDHFPQRTATAMGIAITSGWIGLAFSSPIIGWLAGGSTLGHALLVLPWLACAMVLVNMVLTITLRKLPAR